MINLHARKDSAPMCNLEVEAVAWDLLSIDRYINVATALSALQETPKVATPYSAVREPVDVLVPVMLLPALVA